MHIYEVHPRKDKRGVDLISDTLPLGRLWHGEPDAASNAIAYAKFWSRSHDAVIRVCDEVICFALEALEAVARTDEAIAEQIFKALETLHKAQEQLQHDINEIRKSD
jgi:serine/threonine protein kinase HipA of HipAB toxin-antitoxin module